MGNCLYSSGGKRAVKVVKEGIYKGVYYCVISYGSHPCCYIGVSKRHPFHGLDYDDVNIACHGGITFSSNHIISDFSKLMDLEEDRGAWFLGWDYAHCDDLYVTSYNKGRIVGKRWTLKELLKDVKDVIEQVQNYSVASVYS